MAIAHDAAAQSEPRRRNLVTDNPLVRAVGRVPLPLGAKLIAGFAVVAALLTVVAVLGLVALNRSNSRGLELPGLRKEAFYEGVLQSDAENLKKQIDFRLQLLQLGEKGNFHSSDQAIAAAWSQLCEDTGGGSCGTNPGAVPRFPVTLKLLRPRLHYRLEAVAPTFFSPNGSSSSSAPTAPATSTLQRTVRREDRFVGSFTKSLRALANKTGGHLDALIAANRRSYIDSRNLLIGVGAGSFALAVALGLLLAASVVAPLRRIRGQLAAIAGGDFAGHAEVANRDEIGALAADVNRMSDELQRAYRELELASEHKSQFLATMSHELRTPLNAIIGFSEVLQEQMFGELNERQIAYVKDVLEAGRHLLSLINDVLDLAKIEAGRMELELSPVAVPDVLRAAVSMHAERASRGGVTLALHTEPDEITITADERRVRQVVFNLLSNAVKFTPADGRIDISARLDDGQVEIAIADTGPGIAAGDLEAIFEEFEQTGAGKQAEEGTGLGLPLSRKLVKLHGGRLWAESAVGRGSTFSFTLPVHHEAEA
jgi:signal transduction histidine kinase